MVFRERLDVALQVVQQVAACPKLCPVVHPIKHCMDVVERLREIKDIRVLVDQLTHK